jgi:hypothetical protein
MSAKFEADSTFVIKGRGLLLAGWIVDGRVKPGMILSLHSFPRNLPILGIEFIYHIPRLRRGLIGLLFHLESEPDTSLWKSLDIKGQILEIQDADS